MRYIHPPIPLHQAAAPSGAAGNPGSRQTPHNKRPWFFEKRSDTWEYGDMGTGGGGSREMAGTRGAGRKHEGLPNGLSCDWHLNGH